MRLMRTNTIQYIKEYEQSKNKPLKVQEKVLERIIKEQKNTEFGRKHEFSKIKTISDFQKKVPETEYDDYKEYIDKIKKGKKNILTKKNVVFFATSSGTTSEQKYIPITKERLKLFKRELVLWSKQTISKKNREVIKGKTLYFAAANKLGETESGIEYGNITGYHVKNLPWYIKKKMIIPWKYYNIKNVEKRSELIAIKALVEKNITQIAFAAPIEILLFIKFIEENKKQLLEKIKKINKKRAEELEKIFNKKEMKIINIWPNIKLISCITADINKTYLEKLYEKINGVVIIKNNEQDDI